MRHIFILFLVFVLHSGWVFAQPVQKYVVPARANVAAYDDENGIPKSAYRESPYYMELDELWEQRRTDSSVIYSYQLNVEKVWKDYRVFLNLRCGRACRVTLGGNEVGCADDSRHWNEFFLTPFFKYGKNNLLTVEAFNQSQGALLERDDLAVGLNGTPYLLFKTDPNIADYTLVADYDAPSATGTFTLDATIFNSKKKGKYYIEVEIWDSRGHTFDRMGRWVVFNKQDLVSVDLSRSWNGVAPWSAESPSLYTAVMRLRNEEMEEIETVGIRFGFRRIEVKEGLLQLNGKPLTIKGVVYDAGDIEPDKSLMRQELLSMKQNNINAVRTAVHSPLTPEFYQLCDSLGLYVICDANLMPLSTQQRVVATDKSFLPLFLRRVENLHGRYKNHVSIIAWSLGNSPDNALCMTAAYKRLKTLDATRPVLFAGAGQGPTTDVISFLRPEQRELRQMLAKPTDRPFLLLSSVGESNFADFEDLWGMVETYRNLQGGFVNAWPLPQAMLSDLRNLYSPFDVHLSKKTVDDAEFNIYNRNDFVDFSQYILEYTLFTNLRPNISAGDIPVAISANGVENVKLRIPPVSLSQGEELFIRFDLTKRQKPGSRTMPRQVGVRVIPMQQKVSVPRKFVNDGPTLTNSQPSLSNITLLFSEHHDWRIDTVAHNIRRPDDRTLCYDYMLRYSDMQGTEMCDVRLTSTFYSTGDILFDYTFSPERPNPRIHPEFAIHWAADSIKWYGLDREVYFPTRHSGLPATVSAPFGPMQRQQMRWCSLERGGERLFVTVVDHQCNLNIQSDGTLLLSPDSSSCNQMLRLHLRHFSESNPSDFYTLRMPETTGGILEPPVISANVSRFTSPLTVTLAPAQVNKQLGNQTIIRYTLDGTEPTETSLIYNSPITLTSTTVVKARLYAPNVSPSFTATRKFNYDYIVSTTFSRPASNPFNVGVDTLLFDGQTSSVTDLSQGWVGFSGGTLLTTVQLSKPINVDNIILRYAHAPDNWAFAPESVTLLLSSDGQNYNDTLLVHPLFSPDDQDYREPQVVELKIPVMKSGVESIKILAQPLRAIPTWHRAKGLKPWLLMDEIKVSEGIINLEKRF